MKNVIKNNHNTPAQNALLMEQNELLKSNYNELEKKYENVVEQLAWFKRQLFGQKSERYMPVPQSGRIDDLFGFVEPSDEPQKKTRSEPKDNKTIKRKSSKISFDDDIPVVETIIDVPESERICPETGEPCNEY